MSGAPARTGYAPISRRIASAMRGARALHLLHVRAFHHHARQGLGAREAHQHAARCRRTPLPRAGSPARPRALPCSAFFSRTRTLTSFCGIDLAGPPSARPARRPPVRADFENAQRRQHAVAGGGVLAEDDVARLLAAERPRRAAPSPPARTCRRPACAPCGCPRAPAPSPARDSPSRWRPRHRRSAGPPASARAPRPAARRRHPSPCRCARRRSRGRRRRRRPRRNRRACASTSRCKPFQVQRAAIQIDVAAVGLACRSRPRRRPAGGTARAPAGRTRRCRNRRRSCTPSNRTDGGRHQKIQVLPVQRLVHRELAPAAVRRPAREGGRSPARSRAPRHPAA